MMRKREFMRRRLAWEKLEAGKRYHYPERGWSGRFQGVPSDNFTAWMVFDEVGQCGVDPLQLIALPDEAMTAQPPSGAE